MAFENKPSSNPDRGKVRTAEELETYGVWVKSGPQDMTNAMKFGEDAVPYDTDFDMGFGDMPRADREPPDMPFDSFDDGSFVDGGFANGPFARPGDPFVAEPDPFAARAFENDNFAKSGFAPDNSGPGPSPQEDVSAQLLLRIADELSSIRADITTLKKEFAEIRSESGPDDGAGDAGDIWTKGFFSGDDDGKITLTDNEMDNILSSPAFTEKNVFDDDDGFDSLRDADAAALKELSLQNDTSDADDLADEDDEIDFGMTLGDESDIQDRYTEPENGNVFDTDLEFLTGGAGADNLGIGENDIFNAFAEDLPSSEALEDIDELRELRMHGVDHLTPPPDDSSYLEEELYDMPGEAGDEDAGADEDGFGFDADDQDTFGDAASDDDVALLNETPYMDSLSSMDDDDASAEDLPPMPLDDDDEMALDGMQPWEDDELSDDFMPSLEDDDDELPGGEEMLLAGGVFPLDGELSLDSLGDEKMLLDEDELSLDDDGELSLDSLDDEEMLLDEEGLSLDDGELSLDDDEMSMDDGELSIGEEMFLDDEDDMSLDSLDDDELSMDEEPALDGDGEVALPSWLLSESEGSEAAATPDGEPSLEDTFDEQLDDSLLENISLDMDDFEVDEPVAEDTNIVRVIPEGFKVDAEEALVSFDDDLEAIAENEEKTPPPKKKASRSKKAAAKTAGPGGDADISPDLKGDLKNVLAYMDQLLESLPENKIEEFAKSEHFETYRKLFKELGLV